MIKKIIDWISSHRYIFGMSPKGWNDEKEAEYQEWARTQGDIRGWYK